MRYCAVLVGLVGCAGVSSDPGVGEVVTSGAYPTDLAIAGNDLYFVDAPANQSYRLLRTSTAPGGTPQLVGTNHVIGPITSDGHGVYWLGTDDGYDKMYAWAPGDSAPRMLGTNPTWANGYSLRNLVADADNLYYVDISGSIWKIPKSGSGFVELGKTDTSGGAVALAPDGLWVSTLHGVKLLRSNGTEELHAINDEVSSALAYDSGTVFVAYSGSGLDDGTIKSLVVASDTTAMLTERLTLPSSMIAMNGELYFTTGNNDAAVRMVPYAGGRADAIAVGRMPVAVAIDTSYVYWSDWHPGEIRRIPR